MLSNTKIKKKYRKYIYIEIDDCFGKIRNGQWQISKWKNRMIVIHDGKDKNGNIDKIILLESKEIHDANYSIEELAKIIKLKINEYFKYEELILIGDGARWMKSLTKQLNCKFVLDLFHWKKLVQKTIGYKKYRTQNKIQFKHLKEKYGMTIYKYIVSLIENDKLNEAINTLKDVIKTTNLLPTKKEEIKYLINYLFRNKMGLNHFHSKYYIGSRTESFVNNWIKRKTKIKYCVFGFEIFKNLLLSLESELTKYFFI